MPSRKKVHFVTVDRCQPIATLAIIVRHLSRDNGFQQKGDILTGLPFLLLSKIPDINSGHRVQK
jgi:hypothetical protein